MADVLLDSDDLAELILHGVDAALDAALVPIRDDIAVLKAQTPRDGRDGLPGVPGPPGEKGLNGKDGCDGLDGLGFDDYDIEDDGGRYITHRWKHGDREKVKTVKTKRILPKGKFQEGATYDVGDVVKYGRHTYVCLKDTALKPDHVARDATGTLAAGPQGKDFWEHFVDSGSNGRDGKDGERGPEGKAGKDWKG